MIIMENTIETSPFCYTVILKIVNSLDDIGIIKEYTDIKASTSIEAEYSARQLYKIEREQNTPKNILKRFEGYSFGLLTILNDEFSLSGKSDKVISAIRKQLLGSDLKFMYLKSGGDLNNYVIVNEQDFSNNLVLIAKADDVKHIIGKKGKNINDIKLKDNIKNITVVPADEVKYKKLESEFIFLLADIIKNNGIKE